MEFSLFGTAHRAVLAALVAGGGGFLALARRWPRSLQRQVATAIAGVLVVHRVGSLLAYGRLGDPWRELLPFHLCGVLFFVTAWALWTESRPAFELSYYWTFGGTLHGLVTPDLAEGFPDPRFLLFFATHGALVLACLYGLFVLDLRPGRGGALRAWIGLNAFAVVAAVANLALGTNYLYLARKPAGASLLDALGPWPWYLLVREALALASFTLWSLPFARSRAARTDPVGTP